jgi:outer membrane protein assembly factor BamE (lipoprotein component of BamABCDE complex)
MIRTVLLRLLVLSFVLIGVGLVGVGCMNYRSGTKVERSDAQQIVKGKTTRDELLKMFGPPNAVSTTPDGREQMTWSYSKM